jgi:SHS2 domain-containing protein
MAFRFVDDVATGDCAVEIEAKTLADVFIDSARSLVACMVEPTSVRSAMKWEVELVEDDLRGLLYAWLSELVYIRDSENVMFSEFDIADLQANERFSLRAIARGERIDHSRHDIAVDVKAVTMHMFTVEKVGNTWRAFVIFDL